MWKVPETVATQRQLLACLARSRHLGSFGRCVFLWRLVHRASCAFMLACFAACAPLLLMMHDASIANFFLAVREFCSVPVTFWAGSATAKQRLETRSKTPRHAPKKRTKSATKHNVSAKLQLPSSSPILSAAGAYGVGGHEP